MRVEQPAYIKSLDFGPLGKLRKEQSGEALFLGLGPHSSLPPPLPLHRIDQHVEHQVQKLINLLINY